MAKRKGQKKSKLSTSKPEVNLSPEKKEVRKVKIDKKVLMGAGAVFVVLSLLFLFVKNWFLAAVVNNQPITRLDLLSELEKRAGKQTLDSLITKSLILQEEKKQNVAVPSQEVEDYIVQIKADLEKQGQKLEDVLKLQGMTENDLREQVEIQKAIEKMMGDKIQVTDEEVAAYLAQMNPEAKAEPTAEEKDNAREQLKQQKLATEFDVWMNNLKSQSKIRYFLTF